MTPKRYWIFEHTDDGWRTVPLRRMAWNGRLGALIVLTFVIFLLLKSIGAI